MEQKRQLSQMKSWSVWTSWLSSQKSKISLKKTQQLLKLMKDSRKTKNKIMKNNFKIYWDKSTVTLIVKTIF